MAEENQAVLDMISQLRARLDDLEDDVRAFDGDLSDLAEKLDRIDDRVYLLETEVEGRAQDARKRVAKEGPSEEDDAEREDDEDAEEGASGEDDEDEVDNGMNILTPEAKEKIGETVGDMRVIGREAAETFSELNEAFSDITAPFKSFTRTGRRRR